MKAYIKALAFFTLIAISLTAEAQIVAERVPTFDIKCPYCNENDTTICMECNGTHFITREGRVCPICEGTGNMKCKLCKGKRIVKLKVAGKKQKQDCPNCHATGAMSCWACNGQKFLEPETYKECYHDNNLHWEDCSKCKGVGRIGCSECKYVGYTMEVNAEKNSVAVTCTKCGGRRSFLCSNCLGHCGSYGYTEYYDSRCSSCNGRGSKMCTLCKGTGVDENRTNNEKKVKCRKCDGTGTRLCQRCKGRGCHQCNNTGKINCDNCGGKGMVPARIIPCYYCDGTGLRKCTLCNGLGHLTTSKFKKVDL